MRLTPVLIACALLAVGCGSHAKSAAPSKAEVERAFAGAPPKLTKLHSQANMLVGGSKDDFQSALASLRGYPVVVNKWAAWCAPCREEFFVFQRAALRLGKRVAFLGLDAEDNDGNARKFLSQFPVTYPSYRDPSLKISPGIEAGVASPTTVFFNRAGKLVYAHPGPYNTVADLVRDVKRYAE